MRRSHRGIRQDKRKKHDEMHQLLADLRFASKKGQLDKAKIILEELKETKEDLEYLKESLDDKTVSVVQKSEYKNTDIPYDRDKIKFIEEELESRTLK